MKENFYLSFNKNKIPSLFFLYFLVYLQKKNELIFFNISIFSFNIIFLTK
jgi:hypothetical protein